MPTATESLLNELDRCVHDSDVQALDSAAQSHDSVPQTRTSLTQSPVTQSSVTQSAIQSTETSASQACAASVEVPIGVLEVPIGVWGSRHGTFRSGQSGRIEVFAEETSTVIVFPQGAVIRLSEAVAPGQMMMLTNRNSRQALACRVVKARSYPKARGYAEIEFLRSANGFWGSYVPQGTLKLSAGTLSATPERFSNDFWSGASPKEVMPVSANAATASPVPALTVRNQVASTPSRAKQIPSAEKLVRRAAVSTASGSSNSLPSLAIASASKLAATPAREHQRDETTSERSWILELLSSLREQVNPRPATDRSPSPRPRMAFAWVTVTCLLITVVATGIFLRQRGVVQPDATAQANPTPDGSAVSFTANATESARPESNSSSAVPSAATGVPIIAKTENFPGSPAREFGDNVRTSQPSARTLSLERKIRNDGKPLAAPLIARRSAASLGREVPPNVTGFNSNTGIGALQGVFGTFLPSGGRLKEPQLVMKSAPNYPAMATRASVEGDVTVDAVIDTTGKLTSMKVVSGPLLLQQAALDSLRTWKYQPALLNDKPVPVQTSITVKFRLH
jgi:TonB family protein